MPLVMMSAHLEMLADGKRGRLVYFDGAKSAPFATQAMAREIIELAVCRGRMNIREATLATKHVEESIKVVHSSELDRWCYEVSDREEEELTLVARLAKSLGSSGVQKVS